MQRVCGSSTVQGSGSPTILAPGTGFVEDNFSTDRGGADGSDSNASDGERRGEADEASRTLPPLTSRCAARFLTGRGSVPVCGPGVGDPWCRRYQQVILFYGQIISTVHHTWIHHMVCIHSLINAHLGCFHVLAVMNNAAMHLYVQVYVWMYVFNFLGHVQEETYSNSMFNILMNCRTAFLTSCTSLHSH